MRTLGLLLGLAGSLIGVPGCSGPGADPEVDPVLQGALGLDGSEVVHRVTVGGRGSDVHLSPPVLKIRMGELVEFMTADRRVHTVTFLRDSLSPPATRFIDSTRQGSSPPLVDRGSRFVVTFDGAPAGRYPYVTGGSGEPVIGVIEITDDDGGDVR